jgi:farnesyl-diphosphate farnesyltransferase
LLARTPDLLAWLERSPPAEAILIREVLATILSGQILDIQRFTGAHENHIITLPDEATLDDYTMRVAGCVGAFWTKLGFLTLGEGFASSPEPELTETGIAYGKGLQLVNILRDLPEDLRNGRCYLPAENPNDPEKLMAIHQRWLQKAIPLVDSGFRYAKALHSRRLRTASVLPAMLARETLQLMCDSTWQSLQTRVKVPRSKVYTSLIRAMIG